MEIAIIDVSISGSYDCRLFPRAYEITLISESPANDPAYHFRIATCYSAHIHNIPSSTPCE